jgi:hypothetical protein
VCLWDCNPFFNLVSCVASCNDQYDADCGCGFSLESPAYLNCRSSCDITEDGWWPCAVACFFEACLSAE